MSDVNNYLYCTECDSVVSVGVSIGSSGFFSPKTTYSHGTVYCDCGVYNAHDIHGLPATAEALPHGWEPREVNRFDT